LPFANHRRLRAAGDDVAKAGSNKAFPAHANTLVLTGGPGPGSLPL